MSPGEVQVWLAAIAMIGTLIALASMVFQGIMAYFMAKMKQDQTAVMANQVVVAAKVEEVASKAETAKVDLQANQVVVAAKVEEVARKTEAVKTILEASGEVNDKKLDNLSKVAKATHVLVNSNMAVQLRLNQAVTRRLADITKDPVDVKAAELAEKMYIEHQGKQREVDEQPGTDAEKQGHLSSTLSAMEENTIATKANTDAMTGAKPDPEEELRNRQADRPI